MAYGDNFKLADELLAHLKPTVAAITDPLLASKYTGFFSVSAVAVYELAIKEIFCSFGERKHKVFGTFARSYFDRINGKIQYHTLSEEYARRFGEKYEKRFKLSVATKNKRFLRQSRKDILSAYNNLIVWRNQFAHEGVVPANATFDDAAEAYELGKTVIDCLAAAMRR